MMWILLNSRFEAIDFIIVIPQFSKQQSEANAMHRFDAKYYRLYD